MRLDVDHAVFGGTDLDALADRFAALGFEGITGGTHADDTTRMRLIPFRDGSYLELIAPTEGTDPSDAGYWPVRLGADAGPTAWAIRADDARDVACDAIRAGFAVEGPTPGGRTTPAGRGLEWDAVTLVDDAVDPLDAPTGEALPFVPVDRTPRRWRVPPAETHVGPVSGVGGVVLAVADLDAWLRRFRRLADVASAVPVDLPSVAGDAVAVPGSPVVLVDPSAGTALANRLDRFGPGPCGYLLAVDDVADARDAYPIADDWRFVDRDAAWFESEHGTLGVVAVGR